MRGRMPGTMTTRPTFRTAAWRAALAAAILAVLLAAPAAAATRLADVGGHIQLGYAHVFTEDAPGGSLSAGAGLDVPVASRLRVGLDVGYHLLGSRTLIQGSLSSGLDYSVFEAIVLARWNRGGPITLTAGPGLFIAHADLASSPIGATFSSKAIGQTRFGVAFGAIAVRGHGPVRAGIEAGARVVPLGRPAAAPPGSTDDKTRTWTVATLRLALLY